MAGVATAAPGDLDASFGTGGQVTTAFAGADSGGASAMLIQPDGRIVVGGNALFDSSFEFAIGRYLPNGAPDQDFGDGGATVTDFTSSGSELGNGLALQPDGKLLLAGEAESATFDNVLAVARYHANGVLDSGFDGDGKVVTDVQTTTGERANAIALQSTGKIVVAGYGQVGNTNEIVLARYLSNGTLDTTFGTAGNGKLVIAVTASQGEIATSILVLPDDSLLVGGSVADSTGFNEHFMLRHLSKDGGIDGTFGDASGRVITAFTGAAAEQRIAALAREPDGGIVAVGFSPQLGPNEQFEVYVARYMPDGTLDPSFAGGTGREAFLVPGGVQAFGNAVAIAPDGDIVIAGDAGDGAAMIARLLPDGTLDPGFGSGGARVIPFDNNAFDGADANGVALMADGGIVAAGDVQQQNEPGGFALMKVDGDSADLSVSASAASAVVRPEGLEKVTLTAHNAGPQASHLVKLTITPPAGAGQVTVDSGSAFSCTGSSPVTCSLSSLASGGSSALTASYAAPASGSASMSGTATAATVDPNAANNSAATAATVDGTAPTVHMKLGKVTLGKLRTKGKLPVIVTASEAGTVHVVAKLSSHVLANGSLSFSAAGTHTLVLHLSKRARRRLGASTTVKLRLGATASDIAGNTSSATLAAKLHQPTRHG
jgi:uncharacterized delta-60 repeat protein